MNKHTPGPWKYGIELSSRSGEWLISFDAGYRGRGISIAETKAGSGQEEANARLISAAPELLEALDNTQQLLERLGLESSDEYQANASAIAKAKGETK